MEEQMKVLRGLYKAQVELAEVYDICHSKDIENIYALLENTVIELENKLEIFKEE